MSAYTLDQIQEIYNSPLMDLIYRAATIHRENHDPLEVQVSTLLSIKTGGCAEDCAYCPQAARYNTGVENQSLMSHAEVFEAASKAKEIGSSRLCMGAAWRNVKDDKEFDHVLGLVSMVNDMEMEVCCTLGMVTENQAKKLSNAGLYAYNHNLDSSEDFYKEIISTRGYQDRLTTLDNVRKANITVCSGGIIGMGESPEDRCKMLYTLALLDPQPESVPINALVPVEGTPLENQTVVDSWDMIRMVAVTRIVLPKSVVRLSAGRTEMSKEAQALCFMAGAGSIFAGEKLLTTPNPDTNEDLKMMKALGLKPKAPFKGGRKEKHQFEIDENTQEKVKWSRPEHKIEANEAYRKKSVAKISEEVAGDN